MSIIIGEHMNDMPYRQGVNIIIIDRENKFLVVQKVNYADNQWNFVGGGREAEETLEENMYRELWEELSTPRDVFEPIGVSSHKIEYDYPADLALKVNGGKYRGQSYEQVVLRFVGNKSDIVILKDELRNHKWIEGVELASHLIFPNQFRDHSRAIVELLPETRFV